MVDNIWIFGDSFASYTKSRRSYHTILQEALNVPVTSLGLEGTAQEYTFYTVDKNKEKFSKNDVIIVFLTDVYRQWFFEDKPRLASSSSLLKHFSGKDKKFFLRYFSEYNSEHVKFFYQKLFLDYLDLLTRDFKYVPLIIKNFKHTKHYQSNRLNYSTGFIYEASINEFSEKYNPFLDPMFHEFRTNHLSEQNHQILADKLIDYINGETETVDLTSGFVKGIYK